MPNYRRAFAPGASWFFTVNLLDRRSDLLTNRIDALREATRWTQARQTLPPEDTDFSMRWRLIKSHFAKSIPKGERLSRVREARGERGIWQQRFWEHVIRDERDYGRHVEYCYINPVKHGLVGRVQDWPFSSFHRDVGVGLFPADWAGQAEAKGEFGERP
jgi:putative transposase